MMESIHTDISNIITEHTQSIDENAYSSQKISVNCTGEIPNIPFYTESSKKDSIYGEKKLSMNVLMNLNGVAVMM